MASPTSSRSIRQRAARLLVALSLVPFVLVAWSASGAAAPGNNPGQGNPCGNANNPCCNNLGNGQPTGNLPGNAQQCSSPGDDPWDDAVDDGVDDPVGPGDSSTDPGDSSTDPGGSSTDPDGSSTDPGGSSTDPGDGGGPSTTPTEEVLGVVIDRAAAEQETSRAAPDALATTGPGQLSVLVFTGLALLLAGLLLRGRPVAVRRNAAAGMGV